MIVDVKQTFYALINGVPFNDEAIFNKVVKILKQIENVFGDIYTAELVYDLKNMMYRSKDVKLIIKSWFKESFITGLTKECGIATLDLSNPAYRYTAPKKKFVTNNIGYENHSAILVTVLDLRVEVHKIINEIETDKCFIIFDNALRAGLELSERFTVYNKNKENMFINIGHEEDNIIKYIKDIADNVLKKYPDIVKNSYMLTDEEKGELLS